MSRSGPLAAIDQLKNTFAEFCLYQFPPHINQGMFGWFISAVREKGVKRALGMVSNEQALVTEFQAILDQCPAPWWDPAALWPRANDAPRSCSPTITPAPPRRPWSMPPSEASSSREPVQAIALIPRPPDAPLHPSRSG